jgi:hypothetical protein
MGVARVTSATWTCSLVLPLVVGVGYLAAVQTVSNPYRFDNTQSVLVTVGSLAALVFVAVAVQKIERIRSVGPTKWFGPTFLLTVMSTSVLLLFQSIELWPVSPSDHHVAIGLWIALFGALIIIYAALKFSVPIIAFLPALDFAIVPLSLYLNLLRVHQSPNLWCFFQEIVQVHAKYAVVVASANTMFLLVLLGLATQSHVLSRREFAIVLSIAIVVVAFGLQHFYYSIPPNSCDI